MRIPVYLAIAQWVVLLGLGVLVTLMFRQLGRHLSLTRGVADLGPPVGTRAAPVELEPLARMGEEFVRPGDGIATLLAFVDPTCPSCEELVANLNGAESDGELAHLRTVLLISEPASYLQISEPFRITTLAVGRMLSQSTLTDYRVTATPLLVAIDGAGVVRAAGPALHRQDVRSFVWASLSPTPVLPGLPVLRGAHPEHDHDMMGAVAHEER